MTVSDLVGLAVLGVIGHAIVTAVGRIGASIVYGIVANIRK